MARYVTARWCYDGSFISALSCFYSLGGQIEYLKYCFLCAFKTRHQLRYTCTLYIKMNEFVRPYLYTPLLTSNLAPSTNLSSFINAKPIEQIHRQIVS